MIKIYSINQLLITIFLLKEVDLMKMSYIFQVHPSVKLDRDKLFVSIPFILLMWKLTFMRLIDKHFPRHHKYYKLLNRSNIILSCSCMPNMNNHPEKKNCNVMNNPAPSTTKTFNCHRTTDCPMDDYCLSECLIYKTSVSTTIININIALVKIRFTVIIL